MTEKALESIPVFILAGFLGSGKTTLLQRILLNSKFSDSAVIVNEFGEIGLDHELLTFSEDRTIVMPGGCLCCTIREDIEKALRILFDARDAGEIPPFRRLIIETTGIADPHPLIFTLHTNPLAAARLMKPRLITIVDGVLGADTLSKHQEAIAQVVAADSIVISKSDLNHDTDLERMSREINPWAAIEQHNLLVDDLESLFDPGAFAADGQKTVDLSPSMASKAESDGHHHVQSFCLVLEQALDWVGFGIWMTMLLHRHGQNVLRVKAMLNIDGHAGPVVFHSAQHLVHPLQHLDIWPSAERRSRLVFVVRGIDPQMLERSLRVFDSTAKRLNAKETKQYYLLAGAGGTVMGHPIRRPTAPRWLKG